MNRSRRLRVSRTSALLACSTVGLFVSPLHAEEKNVSVTLGASQQTAAQTANEKPAAPAQAPKAAASIPKAATAGQEVPKDPNNQKGISPFWEKIVQGDTAAIAHDYVTALSYYQSALTSDPKNPIGHLRMAEVAIKQNQLDKVSEYIGAALRFSQDNLRTQAQALFLSARLEEQKGAFVEAITVWAKYKALAIQAEDQAKQTPEGTVPPAARVHVTTADVQTAALTKRNEMLEAYAVVKERIKKNVDAADEATGGGAATK